MNELFDVREYLEIPKDRPLELRVCHIASLWYEKVLNSNRRRYQLDTIDDLFPGLIIEVQSDDGNTKEAWVDYQTMYIKAYKPRGHLFQGSKAYEVIDIIRGLYGSVSNANLPGPTNDIKIRAAEELCDSKNPSKLTELRSYYAGLIEKLDQEQLDCFKTVFKSYIDTVMKDLDSNKYKNYKTTLFPFSTNSLVFVLNNYLSSEFNKGNYSDFFLWMNLGTLLRNEIYILTNKFDSSFNIKKNKVESLNSEEVFIEESAGKLRNRMYVEEETVPTQGAFINVHPDRFFGREEMIERVLAYIGKEKIILISGEGGIGKTEFCREVLERVERAGMPFKAVSLIECRTFDDMIKRIAGQFGIAIRDQDKTEQIEKTVLEKLYGLFYLDNFEDIISEKNTGPQEQEMAISFLRKCRGNNNVTVLISSRYKLEVDFAITEEELDVLDDEAAVRLFTWLWYGKDNLLVDDDIRDFVVKDLYKYPLAIILTAKQRRFISSISRLREKWRTHWSEINVKGMENKRHRSLTVALHMTYMEIKEKENARTLWELFTLFPDKIEESVAEKLVDEYDDALKAIVNLGIVHMNDGYLSVHPTLRKFIKETEEYSIDIKKISLKLLDYYTSIIWEDEKRIWALAEFDYIVELDKNASFFEQWMSDEKSTIGVITMISIRIFLQNNKWRSLIYRRHGNLILRDREYAIDNTEAIVLEMVGDLEATVLKYMGDLMMRTANFSKAEIYLKQAETRYRQICKEPELGDVLKAMGDLALCTDNFMEAESYYKEAESIYRRIHDSNGLVSVLEAMRNIELRTNCL